MRLCPWSLALASSIPVLGLESVCPRKGCPWPWPRIFFVSLASSLVSSTPPLVFSIMQRRLKKNVTVLKEQGGFGLPANPVNDQRIANAVTLKTTFRLP